MANSGGKREGAGRKPLPYKTKVISFRVKSEFIKDIKTCVLEKIKELNNGQSNT
jgi:hypothetical protein